MIQEFSHKRFTHENDPFSVSFSAGIHTIDDSDTTLKEAIKEADAALYEAKRLGRARVSVLKVKRLLTKRNTSMYPLWMMISLSDRFLEKC